MNKVTPAILADLRTIVGDSNVITNPNTLRHGSRDFYWFSPILKRQLDDKAAEVIVRPQSVEALKEIIALAVREQIPITPQGAATGNYGQGIPLHGGILLSTKGLKEILTLTPEAIQVQAGVIMSNMEREARNIGAELRFFPSTLPTATAGGFLAGGSGGIGSITWGTLWDEGNVLRVTALTIEAEPQTLTLTTPEALRGVIHHCGLTCIITDLTLALAPAQPWQQYTIAFDTFEAALRFGEMLAYDEAIAKRLVTVVEWPLPSYFGQLINAGACPEGKALMLLHLTLPPDDLQTRAASVGGTITWHGPPETYLQNGVQVSEFTWNHTTLWAIKADESLTYLQDSFNRDRVYEQLRQRKERFGDEVLEHIEFMKSAGEISPQGLTVVRFRSEERLNELIAYCESLGIRVSNPHTHYLDKDIRWNGQPILDAKARWDPHGILNPGHLQVLET
jgi:FAD/FMN-containing dehydrogenase